uniref:solute carrier family 35 member F3 n=1 Tax=Pristiophorus japonicus TaxID=55135 RepID=UPI00398E5614
MKKHSARVAPLTACNSPVLTLTKVEGDERPEEAGGGRGGGGPSRTEAETRGEAGGGGGGGEGVERRAGPVCCRPRRCSVGQLKKALWGSAVVLSVCSSWAGTSQLARLTFRTFDAPFAVTWFATAWNLLFFPLYYTGYAWSSEEKQSPLQRFRECCRFFGDDGLTIKIFFSRTAPFCVLWTLTNYLYLLALKKISATDASALFCCNKAFVFLLSWIVLRDKFMGVRIVAAIFAIAGIVMITYADGFHSHSVIGITLVVASASMSALYKVLFKMLLGSAKYGEAALFLTVLGIFNITFITCVPVILYFTDIEHWTSFSLIPWEKLCGMAILLLSFNILMNFGIAVTSPTLISVGVVLSVPVNAVADAYSSDIVFNSVRVIAILIICLGFLLLLLPEDWDRLAMEFIARFKVSKKEEPTEERAEFLLGAAILGALLVPACLSLQNSAATRPASILSSLCCCLLSLSLSPRKQLPTKAARSTGTHCASLCDRLGKRAVQSGSEGRNIYLREASLKALRDRVAQGFQLLSRPSAPREPSPGFGYFRISERQEVGGGVPAEELFGQSGPAKDGVRRGPADEVFGRACEEAPR